MKKFSSNLKIKYFSLILVFMATIFVFCTCSSDAERTSEIVGATIKNDRNTVKIEITLSDEDTEKYKDEKLYLLSLESGSLIDGVTIVGEGKAKGKMTFTVELDSQKSSFLSSPLVLVKKSPEDKSLFPSYTPITELEYISNPSILATKNYAAADSNEIKGLCTSDLLDCSAIGAKKTLIDVEINSLMTPEYKDGAINYLYDDVSYYFDGETVELLDKKITTATALGLKVYLRTFISAPSNEGEEISALYSIQRQKKISGYAINANDPVAMGYLRAFYTFLAERYNSKEALAIDIIIGEKVNDYKTNCAASDDAQFEAAYFAWARVAHNIFKSYNKNSQIYLSVDANLRVDGTESLGSKVFLSHFAADAKKSGDYDYAIALSLGNGEDLGDILSGKNSSLSLINANSFSSFTDLISSEEMLCNGKERDIIIDSLSLPAEMSEQNRSAYYVYTYYKAAEAGFDAFIYSAGTENCNIFNSKGERRDFFYSMLISGTQYYNQLYTYLGKIQNADIPKLADYVFTDLYTEENIPCEISSAALRNRRELGLGVCDMAVAGSAYDAAAQKNFSTDGHERTHLTMSSRLEDGTAALVLCNVLGKDIIEAGYIGINMYTQTASDVELIISRIGGDGEIIYIGEAEIGSIEKTYFFNLSGFMKKIDESDKFTLSIRIPEYAEVREATLTVSDIALYGSSGAGSTTITSVIIVALSTLAVCGVLFLLTKKRAQSIKQNNRKEGEGS